MGKTSKIIRLLGIALVGLTGVAAQIGLAEPSALELSRSSEEQGFLGFQFVYEESPDTLPYGAFKVLDLYPGGSAEKAGLERGDRIVKVNGVPFRFADDVQVLRAFEWVTRGERIVVEALRGGRKVELELTAAPFPAELARTVAETAERIELQRRYRVLRQLAVGDGLVLSILRDAKTQELEILNSDLSEEAVADLKQLLSHSLFAGLLESLEPGSKIELRVVYDEAEKQLRMNLSGAPSSGS